MIALYGFLSRISGCMAGVCAVLAVLATPSSGRADDASQCSSCCMSQNPDPMAFTECYQQCMEGSGSCALVMACDVTCRGSYPQCGVGKCDAMTPACDNHSCKIIVIIQQCECTTVIGVPP